MALLVVLAVISVLMAAALQLARTTGASALAIGRAGDRLVAQEQARSGIQLALALLTEDAQTSDLDSVQENWANAEKRATAVSRLGYKKKGLTLDIRDELGKLQVNALVKEYPGREMNPDQYRIWEQFFESGSDPDKDLERPDEKIEPDVILNSILDWLDDRDDGAVTGLSGAESDYYQSLDIPYVCANGPFTHISELFLVKGVVPEVFSREKQGEQSRLFNGNAGKAAEEKQWELSNFLTVHGLDPEGDSQSRYRFPGLVNVNTATEPVLRALLPADKADQAPDLVAYRMETAEKGGDFLNTLEKGWVTQLVSMPEKKKQIFERCIRYTSDLFRVISSGEVNGVRAVLSALVRREQDTESGRWQCRVIQIEER